MIRQKNTKAGPFVGNALVTKFSFRFRVTADTDLQVVHVDENDAETTLVKDTHYSVTLNTDQLTDPGGSITYPLTGDPLPRTDKLVILRDVPYTQPVDLAVGPYSPRVLEDMLDRTIMLAQQHRELFQRTVLGTGSDVVDSLVVPKGERRHLRFIRFDASGVAQVVKGEPPADARPIIDIAAALPTAGPDDGVLLWESTLGSIYMTQGGGWVNAQPAGSFASLTGSLADAQMPASAVVQHEGDMTIANFLGNLPDAKMPASAVVQHEAALSVTESQISDLGTYAALPNVGTQTFLGLLRLVSGQVLDDQAAYRDMGFALQAPFAVSASFNLGAQHVGHRIVAEAHAGIGVTIQPNATTAIRTGAVVGIANNDDTAFSIFAAGGVTLEWYDGVQLTTGNRTLPPFRQAALWKRATDTWVIMGDALV